MYKVGEPVVCVKNHSRGFVQEGQIYTVKGLMIFPCKCQTLVIDVGVRKYNWVNCHKCGVLHDFKDVVWLAAKLFRPLDDLYNTEIEELTEVLEQPVAF